MKKNTFIFLMIVESFFALASIGLLFNEVGAIVYLYALIAFAIVFTPLFIRLKKEPDEKKKRKIRLAMALILLLPIVAAVVAIAIVVVGLMLYF